MGSKICSKAERVDQPAFGALFSPGATRWPLLWWITTANPTVSSMSIFDSIHEALSGDNQVDRLATSSLAGWERGC